MCKKAMSAKASGSIAALVKIIS